MKKLPIQYIKKHPDHKKYQLSTINYQLFRIFAAKACKDTCQFVINWAAKACKDTCHFVIIWAAKACTTTNIKQTNE